MPADDGLRLDENEGTSPLGPEPRERDPEGSVERREPGPRMPVDVDRELLTEGQLHDGLVLSATEQRGGAVQNRDEEDGQRPQHGARFCSASVAKGRLILAGSQGYARWTSDEDAPGSCLALPLTEEQKIRSRLRRYERALAQEKRDLGSYRDGAGKRYEIGPHYMLLGENEGAIAAFGWFEREFDDDVGRPDHLLCWSLALHRTGDDVGAAKKLRQAMLSNLYLLPHLLGRPISKLDIWHGSSDEEPDFLEQIPESYLDLWRGEEKDWAAGLYESAAFRDARERTIEICWRLDGLRPGPERSALVRELSRMQHA